MSKVPLPIMPTLFTPRGVCSVQYSNSKRRQTHYNISAVLLLLARLCCVRLIKSYTD